MAELRPSWGHNESLSLAQSWDSYKASVKTCLEASGDKMAVIASMEEKWQDKLDRLYLNTAMTEAAYSRFVGMADEFFTNLEANL